MCIYSDKSRGSPPLILLGGLADWRMADTTDEPRRKFRINAKNLFLTWPKNDMDPAEVMNKLIERFTLENVSYVCVSEEKHADGTPHIHAVVCLKEKTDIKNANDLDSVGGKHGNYQAAKKVRDVVQYVQKGGKFVEHGECPKEAKGKITSLVSEAIRSGQSLDKVDEMDSGFFMMHQRQIKEYYQFQQLKKLKETPPRPPLIMSRWKHVFYIGFGRFHKEKQYWIVGPTNTGKTGLVLELLADGFRGFLIPSNNDFSEFDDYYDFAYYDEFKGQLSLQFLNMWLEGVPMHLNTKGGSKKKTRNIPTFILSNFLPSQCYPTEPMSIIATLETRVFIINTQ